VRYEGLKDIQLPEKYNLNFDVLSRGYKLSDEDLRSKRRNSVYIFHVVVYPSHPSFLLLSLSTVATPTYVKTHKLFQVCKQVVTNLFTICRQVVFALLVPSCCNKFGTSC
jgi:hypothetical protein